MTSITDLVKIVQEEAQACFAAWGNSFSVFILPEVELEIGESCYFNGVVKHRLYNQEFTIRFRMRASEEIEIETGDHSWEPMTAGNMFTVMWFQSMWRQAAS